MSQDLRRQVGIACQRFLKETMRIMAGGFDSQDMPRRTVRSLRMVPAESGRTIGQVVLWEELDWGLILDRVGADMQATKTWEEASEAIQRYIDAHDIQGAGLAGHDVENGYLLPLVKFYLEEVVTFDYVSPVARRVTASLLRHLDLRDDIVVALIALDGFAADAVFNLEKGIRMRPIEASELLMLGRDDIPPGITSEWPRPELLIPNTDWWICEARIPNRRGTADGWNRANNIEDTIALALRAFKGGGLNVGLARKQLAGPFGS